MNCIHKHKPSDYKSWAYCLLLYQHTNQITDKLFWFTFLQWIMLTFCLVQEWNHSLGMEPLLMSVVEDVGPNTGNGYTQGTLDIGHGTSIK